MSRLRVKIHRSARKNKGCVKDPFLYFGAISVVLFLFISFGTSSILGSIFEKTDSFFLGKIFFSEISEALANDFNQALFVGPVQISLGESPELILVQETSLAAASPPVLIIPQVLGSLSGDVSGETNNSSRGEIISYAAQSGDDLASIAANFGISVNTLLWANDLSSKSKLKAGQELIILPVSGVLHYVKKGDTVAGVAKTYKAEKENIVSFNDLSNEEDIFVGDILVVPDGVMPSPAKRTSVAQRPLSSSYFIAPTNGKISQGLHWYNAVDIANSCGSPVFAAAGGEVLKVKYGWNMGAGNIVTILHPNGVVTSYGHIQKSLVSPGEQVSQGQMVALIGGLPGMPGAGISTGCHVHFSVVGGVNPLAR